MSDLRTNFRKNENIESQNNNDIKDDSEKKDLTQEEFEDYVAKSGAKGSFMVYRSTKKEEELGLDEI